VHRSGVTDLDNTLYDWFEAWYESFNAMIAVLVDKSGVPRDELLAEAKKIHERNGTSEYSFLIEELPCLQKLHPGADLAAVYSEAVEAYRSARERTLRLFPGVWETLLHIKAQGTLLVAYTDSLSFYSKSRVRDLKLDGLLDFVFSPPDHPFPEGFLPEQKRRHPPDHYELRQTRHHSLPRGESKPNPRVLLDIIAEVGSESNRVVYVGDSKVKDVSMAQQAGVIDVWAAYGEAHQRQWYDLLRSVTHWTQADVDRERLLKPGEVAPNYTLRSSFSELRNLFSFAAFPRSATAINSEV
jgi:phosphoglycolate phosphatase